MTHEEFQTAVLDAGKTIDDLLNPGAERTIAYVLCAMRTDPDMGEQWHAAGSNLMLESAIALLCTQADDMIAKQAVMSLQRPADGAPPGAGNPPGGSDDE